MISKRITWPFKLGLLTLIHALSVHGETLSMEDAQLKNLVFLAKFQDEMARLSRDGLTIPETFTRVRCVRCFRLSDGRVGWLAVTDEAIELSMAAPLGKPPWTFSQMGNPGLPPGKRAKDLRPWLGKIGCAPQEPYNTLRIPDLSPSRMERFGLADVGPLAAGLCEIPSRESREKRTRSRMYLYGVDPQWAQFLSRLELDEGMAARGKVRLEPMLGELTIPGLIHWFNTLLPVVLPGLTHIDTAHETDSHSAVPDRYMAQYISAQHGIELTFELLLGKRARLTLEGFRSQLLTASMVVNSHLKIIQGRKVSVFLASEPLTCVEKIWIVLDSDAIIRIEQKVEHVNANLDRRTLPMDLAWNLNLDRIESFIEGDVSVIPPRVRSWIEDQRSASPTERPVGIPVDGITGLAQPDENR